VAAPRRVRARLLIPREILREAQRLQLLEISIPRSCSAQETLVRQSTSSAQTLERAHVSAFDGIVLTELLQLPPGRVHRGAHAFAHRAKHREVRGVGKVFLNERDGDIEGKARDGDAHLRIEVLLSLTRACLDAACRFGDHREWCRVRRARRCSCRAPDLRFQKLVVRFRPAFRVFFLVKNPWDQKNTNLRPRALWTRQRQTVLETVASSSSVETNPDEHY
jgi:hypothetical protein